MKASCKQRVATKPNTPKQKQDARKCVISWYWAVRCNERKDQFVRRSLAHRLDSIRLSQSSYKPLRRLVIICGAIFSDAPDHLLGLLAQSWSYTASSLTSGTAFSVPTMASYGYTVAILLRMETGVAEYAVRTGDTFVEKKSIYQ